MTDFHTLREIVNETFKKPCMVLGVCMFVCVHAFCKCVLEFHKFVRYINYIPSHHAVVQFNVSYQCNVQKEK
jgi:hypothetical protein